MSAPVKGHALLIVEHDFLSNHVGVRRVILYYWRQLLDAGYVVSLATPRNNALFLAEPISLDAIDNANRDQSSGDTPCWSTNDPVYQAAIPHKRKTETLLRWKGTKILLDDYDVSIITAPWICANGLPEGRYTAGIVYDLVPNFIACGALSFGFPVDIYEFAWQHDVGNHFFLKNVDYICCISESTKRDFIDFYSLKDDPRVVAVVPFKVDTAARIKAHIRSERPSFLLVNALDPRKNISQMGKALKLASTKKAFDVVIVGRERMPLGDALSILHTLVADGLKVEWYSTASDHLLHHLYAEASVMLFPSFYEGLGLPILEAQSHGVPAVSSNTSSCVEINMNAGLCVDPNSIEDIAEALINVHARPQDYLRGVVLRDTLMARLNGVNVLPFLGAKRPSS